MKIYKTEDQKTIIENQTIFKLTEADFDVLINSDNIEKECEQFWNNGLVTSLNQHNTVKPVASAQEIWACGVTYLRSKVGRQEESKEAGGGDFYEKVYHAERPEVFFKATPGRTVGDAGKVKIRADSTWDVPEPELTLVVNSKGKINGYTIGNDMSSRSIEGENPLYLPQAKTYDDCASVGPCISLVNPFNYADTTISLTISRNGSIQFEDNIPLTQMKRKPEELVGYVFRECSFPYGCLIMTGTGIVPPNTFTLEDGDVIKISISGIGTLTNTVYKI